MAVRGLNQVLSQLNSMSVAIQDDIKDIIEEGVQMIWQDARRLAPGPNDPIKTEKGSLPNTGGISQFIDFAITNNGFAGQVFIEAAATKFAIYVEFGTGVSAAGYVPTLPPEFQQIARRYYINGLGTIVKSPFLLPAYFNNRFKILKAMKDKLESHGFKVNLIP